MGIIRNLIIRAGADFSEMRRELDRAQRDISSFQSGVNKTLRGIGLALAGLGIGAEIKNAVSDAMKVEAALMVIDRQMNQSAKEFTDWAKASATAFNMSRSEAIRYGATYSNLITTFVSDGQTINKYTQDLLKASAVTASATGRSMEDVMERIRSGMLGNTEAIEDLGINIFVNLLETTKAFQRFAGDKSWDQLSFQTQQQIRYFAILEQVASKFGTEVYDNTASRQAQFIAQLKNVRTALGQAFLPIYNYILPALTKFAVALANVVNFIAQFTTALFGGSTKSQKAQTDATDAQAGAVGGLGDAYEDAGNKAKAAGKKAKGSLASFDQLNVIGKSTGSSKKDSEEDPVSSTNVGGGFLGGVGTSMIEVSDKAREMAEKVKAAFEKMKKFIVDNKEIIIAALAGITAAFTGMWLAAQGAEAAKAFAALKTFVAFAGPLGLIATAVATIIGLATLLYQKWDDLDTKWKIIATALLGSAGLIVAAIKLVEENWDSIMKVVNTVWNSVLKPFNDWLIDKLVKGWEGVSKAAEWLWKNVLTPFGGFLNSFKAGVLNPLGAVLSDALGVAFKFVADVAKDLWNTVLVPFGNFLSGVFSEAVKALSDIFTNLWNNVLKPFGSWLKTNLEPTFDELGKAITNVWQNVLKPFGEFMLGNFKTIFHTVFDTIGSLIGNFETSLKGLINFIAGVFTADWKRAWEGINSVFEGIFKGLYNIAKTPLNLIIDAINKVIDGINGMKFNLPAWMGGGSFGGLNIKKIPRLARGGLAYGPTLAMVGDNRGAASNPEVIAPLDKLEGIMNNNSDQQVVNVLNAILRAVQGGLNVNVTISQREVANAAISGIKDHQRRTGALPFPV